MNTTNKEDYHFGDRLLTIVQFKYVKDVGNISVIPNVGVVVEKMNDDELGGVAVDHTGGHNVQNYRNTEDLLCFGVSVALCFLINRLPQNYRNTEDLQQATVGLDINNRKIAAGI
jgi:hypothetical protein